MVEWRALRGAWTGTLGAIAATRGVLGLGAGPLVGAGAPALPGGSVGGERFYNSGYDES